MSAVHGSGGTSPPSDNQIRYSKREIALGGRFFELRKYSRDRTSIAKIRYFASGFFHALKYIFTLGFLRRGVTLVRPGLTQSVCQRMRTDNRPENIRKKIRGYKGGMQNEYETSISYSRAPRDYANSLETIAEEVKQFLNMTGEQDLFEIPMQTNAGMGERHTVSLVIDRTNNKLYFIDTKGHDPDRLQFMNVIGNQSTGVTVADFISDLIPELTDRAWTLETTDFLQKPRDCAPAAEAIIRALANQPRDARNLGEAQKEVDHHYSRVEEIRAVALGILKNQK